MPGRVTVIGVDLGTSYVKATGYALGGPDRLQFREASPFARQFRLRRRQSTMPVGDCWALVREAIEAVDDRRGQPGSICISGVAPVVTVFDAASPERAVGIPYWSVPPRCPKSANWRLDLTLSRLALLAEVAADMGFKSPLVTDLVGYINYRLTGNLTLNSIAMAELGLRSTELEMLNDGTATPQHGAPAQRAGVTQSVEGIRDGFGVCFGCPDTVASLVGCGIARADDVMLYLGTFGSLLRLDRNLPDILTRKSYGVVPYTWILSVPGLGPAIERFAARWCGVSVRRDQLRHFDRAAMQAAAGADGALMLVPFWTTPGEQQGRFRFLSRASASTPLNIRTRAVLEAVAYPMRMLLDDAGTRVPLYGAGGGTISRAWLSVISGVVRAPLYTSVEAADASEATGTAAIAACALTGTTDRIVGGQRRLVPVMGDAAPVVERNLERARPFYRALPANASPSAAR